MNVFPANPATPMADNSSGNSAADVARSNIEPARWTQADSSADVLLRSAHAKVDTTAWAWYQVGEDLHLAGQGDAAQEWPGLLTADTFHAFCTAQRLCLWPTGSGESILGWLLAPASHAGNLTLSNLARSLGEALQTDALARAKHPARTLRNRLSCEFRARTIGVPARCAPATRHADRRRKFLSRALRLAERRDHLPVLRRCDRYLRARMRDLRHARPITLVAHGPSADLGPAAADRLRRDPHRRA